MPSVNALLQDILTATPGGAGSGFTKTYWFDANDVGTTAAPIVHTGTATGTYLTNDAAGSGTTSYNPNSKDTLWNPGTNKFDFTSLKIGDTIELRIDITITNAAAQEINLLMSLAEGSGSPYELNISHAYYKTASSGEQITALFRIYMGDPGTEAGGSRFRIASTDNATIKVNGWFYSVTEV